MRALKSATTAAFDDDYHEALKVYQKMVEKHELPDQGPVCFFASPMLRTKKYSRRANQLVSIDSLH